MVRQIRCGGRVLDRCHKVCGPLGKNGVGLISWFPDSDSTVASLHRLLRKVITMAGSQVENATARVPVTNGADTYPSWRLSDVAGKIWR